MKIFEATVGKQLKIHRNVVNVLAGVCTTLTTLPRIASESETIAIKFKRRSQFQHAFMIANIRPALVRLVGKYLIESWQLFQKAQISFSYDINNSLSDVNDFNISYSYSDNIITTTETDSTSVHHITQSNSQYVSESRSTDNTEQLNCNGDDDDWNVDK